MISIDVIPREVDCPGIHELPLDVVDRGELRRRPDGQVSGRHPRGVCPGCGQIRGLGLHGRMRKHRYVDKDNRVLVLDAATWAAVEAAASELHWTPEAWVGKVLNKELKLLG